MALQQERPLSLNAKSGLVLAGGATVYLGGAFGIEARYDSATVDITSEPPLYSVTLSRPLPNLRFTLEPAPTVDHRVLAHSRLAQLEAAHAGAPAVLPLGGSELSSRLPARGPAEARLEHRGISLPPGVNLGSLSATALTRPEDPETGHLGGNVGLGLQIKLGEHVALVGEGRAFFFPKHVLTWRVSQQGGLVTLPPEVTTALEQQLEPIRFNPAYFHLVGGLAFTF